MIRRPHPLLLVAAMLVAGLPSAAAAAQEAGQQAGAGGTPLVVVADLGDVIHPISAEYLVGSLAEAAAAGAVLYVLRIDTPGGLDTSMRDIIQAFLASPVPVCLFVAPSGARAASAGFFMAMAADVVAMAPGTNMGAASPVSVGGGEIDDTMRSKLMQDAVAYVRSLAEGRQRPQDLAAAAVAEGRSFAAAEAVEVGLADFVAADLDDLLARLSGAEVQGHGTLPDLTGATILERSPSLRQRVLSVLANPQVAYMLMLLGIAGLYFELSTPGAILPGVLGGVSLVLALLAFQILPIDFAGLALIGLAVLFFILEIKVVSFGLLTVAGLIAFVLGSMMLFPGPIPQMRLSLWFVLPTAVAVAGIAATLVQLVLRTHRGRVTTGVAGLVGEAGRSTTELGPGQAGRVFVHGEIWRARADMPVPAATPVEVVAVEDGMVLRVRPATPQKGQLS